MNYHFSDAELVHITKKKLLSMLFYTLLLGSSRKLKEGVKKHTHTDTQRSTWRGTGR